MSTLVEKIRKKMMDRQELNFILKNLEVTDPTIQDAIDDTVEEFNSSYEPKTSLTASEMSFSVLYPGVCKNLLESIKFNAKRNALTYNDAGESVDYFGSKDSRYTELLQYFLQRWERLLHRTKMNMNLKNFCGRIGW